MWSLLPPAVSAGRPRLTLSAAPGESLVLPQLSTATSAQVLGDHQVTKPPGWRADHSKGWLGSSKLDPAGFRNSMSSPGCPGPSPASQALPAGHPMCCLLWPPHLGTPETIRAGSLQLERVGPGAWSLPPPRCPLPRPPLLSGELPAPSHGVRLPYTQNEPRRGGEKPGAWRIHRNPLQGLSGHPMSTERNFLLVLMRMPPGPPKIPRERTAAHSLQGRRSSRSQVSI